MVASYEDLSDGELVALSIAGRDRAFGLIVRRHRDVLYRISYASLGNADDALDAVQDIFVAAFLALKRFDGGRPLRPWLAAVALNRCRDLARRRRVRRLFAFALPIDAQIESVAQDTPGVDVVVADRAELRRTMVAISRLPASLREPLILHTIEGMSQAETAETLGVSEKAVETRLRRARQRLREELDPERS
ncbi:MAG: RNA polymerase subunit sigma-24 [Alphaproteobacteria bacterium 65-37]|nr:MAG: RNA polymerase subunit sigma-24 [Alphaproteobacteria bacterium 65-37]